MRNRILFIVSIIALQSCGGSKKNNPNPSPAKVTLTTPLQNSVCTTGTIISDTESSILFTWYASSNTTSYDLVLNNLLTSTTTTQSTTAAQLTVTLRRNTPYSWYILSKSAQSGTSTQSDTWKFYNAGSGVITYAPFPATITSPIFGQNVTTTSGTINLTWNGSSVNPGTINSYDVYFGTTDNPTLLKNAVKDMFVNDVAVTSKTTYYWKVVTWDMDGNSSDSGLSHFTVN